MWGTDINPLILKFGNNCNVGLFLTSAVLTTGYKFLLSTEWEV